MRTGLGCVVVLALAVAAGAGDTIDAKKLVGKWEPKDAKKGLRLVLEFAGDGKLTVIGEGDGKESRHTGTYKLDGNKLQLNLKVGETELKDVMTITKLTDAELEAENAGKKSKDVFVRVKAK